MKTLSGCFAGQQTGNSVENVSLFVVLAGELLGSGSFGRVFAARWDGRDVAVKVIEHSSETGEQL